LGERGELGLELEPYHAERYTRATGWQVRKAPSLIINRDEPWQMASLDYLADGGQRPVELKAIFAAPSSPWGEAGTDQVPDKHLLQATQQAGIYGADVVDLSALFVGYCHRVYCVPFDPSLFEILTEAGREFWAFVVERRPVGPDWHSSYATEVA